MSTDGAMVNKSPLGAKIKKSLLIVTMWVHLGDILLSKLSQPWRDREYRVPPTFVRHIEFNSKKFFWNNDTRGCKKHNQKTVGKF